MARRKGDEGPEGWGGVEPRRASTPLGIPAYGPSVGELSARLAAKRRRAALVRSLVGVLVLGLLAGGGYLAVTRLADDARTAAPRSGGTGGGSTAGLETCDAARTRLHDAIQVRQYVESHRTVSQDELVAGGFLRAPTADPTTLRTATDAFHKTMAIAVPTEAELVAAGELKSPVKDFDLSPMNREIFPSPAGGCHVIDEAKLWKYWRSQYPIDPRLNLGAPDTFIDKLVQRTEGDCNADPKTVATFVRNHLGTDELRRLEDMDYLACPWNLPAILVLDTRSPRRF